MTREPEERAFARAEVALRKYRRIAQISAPRRRPAPIPGIGLTLDEILATTTFLREVIEEKIAKRLSEERERLGLEMETIEGLRQEAERARHAPIDVIARIVQLRFPDDQLPDLRECLQKYNFDELCEITLRAATATSAADVLATPPAGSAAVAPR